MSSRRILIAVFCCQFNLWLCSRSRSRFFLFAVRFIWFDLIMDDDYLMTVCLLLLRLLLRRVSCPQFYFCWFVFMIEWLHIHLMNIHSFFGCWVVGVEWTTSSLFLLLLLLYFYSNLLYSSIHIHKIHKIEYLLFIISLLHLFLFFLFFYSTLLYSHSFCFNVWAYHINIVE